MPTASSLTALCRRFQQLFSALDAACLYLSPVALFVLLVAGIIALDEYSQHRSFLQAIAEQGVERVGIVEAYRPGDRGIFVRFGAPEEFLDYAYIPVEYYPPEVLQGLQDGQPVRVRAAVYDYERMGVLADAYEDVIHYTGFLGGLEWVLGGCLLVLVVRPELLYLGLHMEGLISNDLSAARASSQQAAPAVERASTEEAAQ